MKPSVIQDLQARLQQRWSQLNSDSSKLVETPRRSESQEARQRELRSRGQFTPRVADCSEVPSVYVTPRKGECQLQRRRSHLRQVSSDSTEASTPPASARTCSEVSTVRLASTHSSSVTESPSLSTVQDGLSSDDDSDEVATSIRRLLFTGAPQEAIEQSLPADVKARAQERAYFIAKNTGCQDHMSNYYEALECEMEILGVPISARVLVRDEEVFEAMRQGLSPELAERARLRAYFIWEATGREDSSMNFFVALKEELRGLKAGCGTLVQSESPLSTL